MDQLPDEIIPDSEKVLNNAERDLVFLEFFRFLNQYLREISVKEYLPGEERIKILSIQSNINLIVNKFL